MTEDKTIFIEYKFTLSDGKNLDYKVFLERFRAKQLDKFEYPGWTELWFKQCTNCPLDTDEYSHCPVAIDIQDILTGFNEILSFNTTAVRVITPEREYFKHCDAKTGLRALMGLVMATSRCPILSKMRGMARYHLPFASIDEIVFRMSSSYLLTQYYLHKDGKQADWDLKGLKKYYQDLRKLNNNFRDRINLGRESDTNLSVLSTLFSISSLLAISLEHNLQEQKELFFDFPTEIPAV
ncbi:MAG: hypothetical protein KAI17_09350 [Thiotrichaceae bacterium]|nr:hypothetical protein [Thiotrichaceae bacterium]